MSWETRFQRELGKAIQQAREKVRLNRHQFAQAVGITWANLYLYETGKRLPTIITLIKLAATANTTAGKLMAIALKRIGK